MHRSARSAALLLSALVLAAPLARAGTQHHVDAAAAPGGDGSSWASAFGDVQSALAKAAAGDEVWVAEGTYFGGFAVPAGVSLLGGFAPGATRVSQRDPAGRPTVLDGQGTQRVLDVGDGSLVDGFTVQNGMAGGFGGGGVLVDGTAPILRNLVLTKNGNSAGRGAALAVRAGGQPVVEGCYFVRNDVPFSGHVVDLVGSGGIYRNIAIYDNKNNGLHFMQGSSPVILSSVFGKNSGRGICDISGFDDPLVENNLFFDNGVSLYHYQGSELHTAEAINALPYAQGNINADPGFADPLAGDYRLTVGSPCIDAGSASPGSAAVDAFGNPRVQDGLLSGAAVADIGPHELAHARLRVGGKLVAGGSAKLAIDGTPGLAALLAVGLEPSGGLALGRFGTLFVDPLAPFAVLPAGATPAALELAIPAQPKFGAVCFQAVALAGLQGNTTNLVDVQIE